MSDLFRKEAVFHATRRLSGAVILATPLSVRLLGALFGGIVLAGVVFACVSTYARKATVTGWLVPDQGLIRATVSTAIHSERRGQGRRARREGSATRGNSRRDRDGHRQRRRQAHPAASQGGGGSRRKSQNGHQAAGCRGQAGACAPGEAPFRAGAIANTGRIAGKTRQACPRRSNARRRGRGQRTPLVARPRCPPAAALALEQEAAGQQRQIAG